MGGLGVGAINSLPKKLMPGNLWQNINSLKKYTKTNVKTNKSVKSKAQAERNDYARVIGYNKGKF